jgi:hypothetical protein
VREDYGVIVVGSGLGGGTLFVEGMTLYPGFATRG